MIKNFWSSEAITAFFTFFPFHHRKYNLSAISVFKESSNLGKVMGGLKNLPQTIKTTFRIRTIKIICLIFFHIILKKKGKNKEISELLQFFHISKLIIR
jgi:hypothetical protein